MELIFQLTFLDHGYRLTFSGYDYLAIKAFTNRNSINGIGNIIGVGKESSMLQNAFRLTLKTNSALV